MEIKATKECLQLSAMQYCAQENTYTGVGCQWGLSMDVEHNYILAFISEQKCLNHGL